jgi:hypothetical protein
MTRQPILALAFAFWPVFAAMAAPPTDQPLNPELAEWFKTLRQPSSGEGCCSIADCRSFESRIFRDHYEVFIHDKFAVPDTAVLHNENKVGTAIACLKTSWNYSFGPAPADYVPGILCFVPAPEA